MNRYNPIEIEKKWQQIWEDNGTYKVDFANHDKPKYYAMSMLPGITGAGIHTGHGRTFQFSDIKVRAKRQQGYNAYHPIGWDSFGLPVENYAIKVGKTPRVAHDEALVNFKRQLKRLGYSYDWSKEVSTADPEYYKWTQWIFNQLFERGLAYQKQSPQWWCDTDQTVLANEQVEGGKCWRCGNPVSKRNLKQWFFKITEYADEILEATDDLDWTEMVKTMQKNWIGRSQGAEVEFAIDHDGYFSYVMGVDENEISNQPNIKVLEKTSSGSLKIFISKDNIHEYENWIGKVLKPGFWNEYIGSETVFIFKSKSDTIEKLQLIPENEKQILDLCNEYANENFESVDKMLSDVDLYAEKMQKITVFTTRPDTLFGATVLILAPEHEMAKTLVTDDERENVENYIAEAARKSEIERMNESREKTGVFTGSYAINPVNGKKIPIWIADYVLVNYGTGAIMAVPAHDERDGEFAKKFNIPVVQVIEPELIDQNNPPRPDVENTDRNVVMCVVKHPTDDTYVTLRWNKFDWHNFVMGGVEDGEDVETAARREILEETGYKNLKLVSKMPLQMNSKFYAAHKQLNRNIHTTVMLFQLDNLDQIETKREAHEDFVTEWTKYNDLSKLAPITELPFIIDWLDSNKVVFTGEGILMNSGRFDGIATSVAREEIVAWLEEQKMGRIKTTYKMRDWLISRQRYWGAPIPIIHCPEHGAVAVPDDQLPVILPEIDDFKPKGGATTALAGATDWVNTTCPKCGKPATRETDTMDGYACSSWYFLRYIDPFNDKQAWDPEVEKHWDPVDFYNGADHAVAHLLYSRFWMRFFYKLGLVSNPEPFKRMMYNAYILAPDGTKMSKSKGNTIDPLEIMDSGYGADSLRVYEMFIAPYDLEAPWDTRGVPGAYRFLNRAWTLTQGYIESGEITLDDVAQKEILAVAHRTAKKVTADIQDDKFNTAVSSMMEAVNNYYKLKEQCGIGKCEAWKYAIESLLQVLSPFAPHITEELWQQIGYTDTIHVDHWPVWDEQYMHTDTITIIVQVNGKLRAKLDVAKIISEDEVKKLAINNENVAKFIGDKEPIKIIYVPGRLVNIVVAN
jgi:leucyl-tRNA synthetase